MRKSPPTYTNKTKRLRALLAMGINAAEVATRLKISRRRVFMYASAHNLPTNPTVIPGGGRERGICRALAGGFSKPQVCMTFKIAPPLLEEVLGRVKAQMATPSITGWNGLTRVPHRPRKNKKGRYVHEGKPRRRKPH